jgi:hypothetical protein
MATYLAKKGYFVEIFEQRPDMRKGVPVYGKRYKKV